VTARTTYPGLLRSAGFNEIDKVDLTAEYLATQHRWLAATLRHEEGHVSRLVTTRSEQESSGGGAQ
jgi:hypothetical protein